MDGRAGGHAPGASHAGRVGVSMLTNVGLADLVARDEDEYVAVAAALAGDLPRLVALRAGMRSACSRRRLPTAPG